MDRNDSQAIEQLFSKLDAVERQAPPRDGEAEAYIRDRIASQPGAPYYMAQTIIVQEQALEAAQARIEELEAKARQHSGGILGGLFGSSRPPQRSGTVPRIGRAGTAAPRSPLPGDAAHNARAGAGGGFLAGAAQTAMGVAGGVLLGNAIAGMFGDGEAQAADDAGAADEGFDGGFDDIDF